MTRALAFVFLAGCTHSSSGPPDPCGGPCGGELVCTRDDHCLPPDEVRAVHISWTVSGAPASATSCAAAPDLVLELRSRTGGSFGFEPVPCAEGMFTVDRLSTDYDTVQLGRASDRQLQHAAIDAAGNATLNLPY
ncbi:MAG TPA: hypothetical protein VHT91_31440 [Kofleriaceae bacterium]|jgi:hypothetical protein|nr:hypothetical protein [Kofleriaceae bacterium]